MRKHQALYLMPDIDLTLAFLLLPPAAACTSQSSIGWDDQIEET